MFHLVTIIFLLFFFSDPLGAATLTVGPGQAYPTITAGINHAASGDVVLVYPNPPAHYPENIILAGGVTVQGVETGATKIVGAGSGSVVTMASGASIINMTISNASSTGIYIPPGLTGANITNNLIVGNATGISCLSTSSSPTSNLTITNNTIDSNVTGVVCSGPITNLIFENNILSKSTTGVDFFSASFSPTNSPGNYNDFFNYGSNVSYTFGPNDIYPPANSNPMFVNPVINDYHLQAGSSCIDAGDPSTQFIDKEVSITPINHTRNDCGAYGGPQRDTTPFQIQNIVVTPGSNTMTISWNANLAYDIANYTVFFDNQSHTIFDDIPTPPYNNALTPPAITINCPATPTPLVCATTISLALSPPNNFQVGFGNQELFFTWAPPSGINLTTGYNLYYETTTAAQWTTVAVGNVTSYTLTGLTNLVVYNADITSLSSLAYFINIVALDDYNITIPHQSNLLSPDIGTTISGTTESPPSATVSNFPEGLAPFPNLPNQGGCFIATAAYGSPLEPQVRLLRLFRDRYLVPSPWGRQFVLWYYRHSPAWADYLNHHEGLKPAVRAGLIPALGLSYFFVIMTGAQKFLILFAGVCSLGGGLVLAQKMKWIRK